MPKSIRTLVLCCWLGISAYVTGQELPPPDSIEPQLVIKVGNYSEGIVFDHDGFAYISHKDTITKVDVKTGEGTVWAVTGAPNGHKVLADRTHLVCDGSRHAVLHLDAEGKILGNASDSCNGKPLRAPNDLTLDPAGGFTSPIQVALAIKPDRNGPLCGSRGCDSHGRFGVGLPQRDCAHSQP